MFSMLRPVTATFRPHWAAASSTCWGPGAGAGAGGGLRPAGGVWDRGLEGGAPPR